MKIISTGVDPGWVNLGWARVQADCTKLVKVTILECQTLNPSTYEGGPEKLIDLAMTICPGEIANIERYVSYGAQRSTHTEEITMVIGMLRMAFYLTKFNWDNKLKDINMVRAIEWKTELVQILSKYYGFDCKFTELDKDFSEAAARFIVDNPERIKTNHEADAICIAALPLLRKQVEFLKKNKPDELPHQHVLSL